MTASMQPHPSRAARPFSHGMGRQPIETRGPAQPFEPSLRTLGRGLWTLTAMALCGTLALLSVALMFAQQHAAAVSDLALAAAVLWMASALLLALGVYAGIRHWMRNQLQQASHLNRAVEQGRCEERLRVAQDLHDDIGARLLSLVYQAPTPELADYARHMLHDLKTITRGLAAGNRLLSHAIPEWKADAARRLAAVGCELDWHFSADADVALSVVQWSAVTRMLRELVSNTIAHAQATRVEVRGRYQNGRLTLDVLDNGRGCAPQQWPHGLGLCGVRRRVMQLGGEVRWAERPHGGIECRIMIPDLLGEPA